VLENQGQSHLSVYVWRGKYWRCLF